MSIIQLVESKILDLSFNETPIIIISGPTGVGKSNLALSLAKKINGVIINADSMQIYRELKIISSQPSDRDKKIISHELYSIRSIHQNFSVMDWLELVKKKLNVTISKNKIPIIVGGTGLYIKSAINGISKIPKVDKVVFEDCTKLFEKIGILEFRKLVEKVDKDFILKNIKTHLIHVKKCVGIKNKFVPVYSGPVLISHFIEKYFKNQYKINYISQAFCMLGGLDQKYETCYRHFGKYKDLIFTYQTCDGNW